MRIPTSRVGRRHRGLQFPPDRQPAPRRAGRLLLEHAGGQGRRLGDPEPLLVAAAQREVELDELKVVRSIRASVREPRSPDPRSGARATNPRSSPSRCRPSASKSGDASRPMPRPVSVRRAACWSASATASDTLSGYGKGAHSSQDAPFSSAGLPAGEFLRLHRLFSGHHAARRAEDVEVEVSGR